MKRSLRCKIDVEVAICSWGKIVAGKLGRVEYYKQREGGIKGFREAQVRAGLEGLLRLNNLGARNGSYLLPVVQALL